jgi:hypothetical protein
LIGKKTEIQKVMKHWSAFFCLWLGLMVGVGAQTLPPPSRTVYKCTANGKTHYSDAPCLGAQKVDVEPTRGLNRLSDRERTGADVQRERQREMFAEAVRPITGMSNEQFDRAARRSRLPPEQQKLCQQLDRQLPTAEQKERLAHDATERTAAQSELFHLRKTYRDSRCG